MSNSIRRVKLRVQHLQRNLRDLELNREALEKKVSEATKLLSDGLDWLQQRRNRRKSCETKLKEPGQRPS